MSLSALTVTTMLGACAVGLLLARVIGTGGGTGSSAPLAPPLQADRTAAASTPARAPATIVARHARVSAPRTAASADEALCLRAAAVGPGGFEGIASSPARDAEIVAAERRIDAALRASPDAFSQAVAAWLDPGHEAPSFRARQERLARFADTTTDARVYALAFRECLKGVDDDAAPGCETLSARQWARLDAGNAMPWVYVLGEAVARGDAAARDEALFQIASAPRIEERPFAVAQAILDHAGSDGAGLVAANELVSQALGMSAAQKLPLYALMSACRDAARQDANAAQLCAEAADLLVQRSDTLALRRVGGAMDFALTGDATRRDRLRDEGMRLVGAPSLLDGGGCAALRGGQAFLRHAAEVGEVVALRERAQAAAAH